MHSLFQISVQIKFLEPVNIHLCALDISYLFVLKFGKKNLAKCKVSLVSEDSKNRSIWARNTVLLSQAWSSEEFYCIILVVCA